KYIISGPFISPIPFHLLARGTTKPHRAEQHNRNNTTSSQRSLAEANRPTVWGVEKYLKTQ
ncbi:unnamed protein product, partial [Amoebophrya sp. A120]